MPRNDFTRLARLAALTAALFVVMTIVITGSGSYVVYTPFSEAGQLVVGDRER